MISKDIVNPKLHDTVTAYDAILIVSFGGPEGMDDVIPFLENVLRGRNVPRERMLGVVLNRADEELESSAYYYQKRTYRPQRVLPAEESLRLVEELEEEVAIAS